MHHTRNTAMTFGVREDGGSSNLFNSRDEHRFATSTPKRLPTAERPGATRARAFVVQLGSRMFAKGEEEEEGAKSLVRPTAHHHTRVSR